MIQSKMIEKEEDLLCPFNHKLPVFMVVWDTKLQKNKKLLCSQCWENIEQKAQVMNFKIVLQNIEENQKQKKASVENVIMMNIKQIEKLQKDLNELKQIVVQQLDQLIGNVDEWIKNVLILGQQNVTYSFFDELDNLIKNTTFIEFNQKSLVDKIIQINQSWNQKIIMKLNLFKSFQESHKCEETLKSLERINQVKEKIKNQVSFQGKDIQQQKQVIKYDNQQKQLESQLIMNQQVELKLIDDSNKQSDLSWAIVFDKTGSIMVSSDLSKIIIWNFENGRLKLSKTYQVHCVLCFVYSQQSNNFISGSDDNTIICWQQINEKEWKYSQPFQQHKDCVNCLLLNKQEDQLISGGNDYSIKIWKVDFIKNGLTFLYSLDRHSNGVSSISFNQSETVMASGGYEEFIIWEKGQKQKWEFKYINEQNEYFLSYIEIFIEFILDILIFYLNLIFQFNQVQIKSIIQWLEITIPQ